MKADSRTRSRVGVIVFAAILLFAVMVVVVGGKTGFFLARSSYFARFPNSQGLSGGNQVRLAGVTVGAVQEVEVPKSPGEDLTVRFDIERRYRHLVRTDSRVEIKTIGLLGDKYLEVTPGSPETPLLEPGSEIAAIRGSELDKILAGSGDLFENVNSVAESLKTILGRVEKGEGFLGEMTSASPEGKELSRSLRQTIAATNALLADVRAGKGLVGRLVADEKLGDEVAAELAASAASLRKLLAAVERGAGDGEGLVPALLGDPEGKKKFFAMVDSLNATAEGLSGFSRELSSGSGLLPKLVRDEAFAKELTEDLRRISSSLASVAEKVDRGEGTAARIVNDPALFEAIDDILVGVNESKLLRWLVRNRQRSGIQARYEETTAKGAAPAPEALGPAPTPEPRE
ncbi:MAG TPA: MlaD family protein [Thermoanaerobaculia bacterium]|nr:MlaD family protein [Thermoanaerobaculia bacterium]